MGIVAGGPGGPLTRREIRVEGTVQGVGFRPYVYHLALEYHLTGWVLNSEQGVVIEVEGPSHAVDGFQGDLELRHPPLAVITGLTARSLEPAGYEDFRIIPSRGGDQRTASVPADAATCEDCRHDVLDPANRRYRYPFTNCTNCGPRFTIVKDIPYDRPKTTMAHFTMCPRCDHEYNNPADRRFHAQPNACPDCGPKARVVDRNGREMAGQGDWLEKAAGLLRWGLVVAVKGLGGYHLACDACDSAAVQRLRERKQRPHRPFAVMARDLDTVRKFCRVSATEEALLRLPAAPIVLLERLPEAPVADEVAPGLNTLGVMLPYTPLHVLLLSAGPELLVMTSGNPSGLPLAVDDEDAYNRLGAIADAFLIHNRPIYVPCDDSVLQVAGKEPFFLRRSRGFVPRPVKVPAGEGPAVLGIGGDMKNAFCLVHGDRAVFSQHLGDMETEEGQSGFDRALEHLQRLTGITPALVGYDMHPGYRSSALARELPAEGHVAVQHHHAHLAACMADNSLDRDVLGLVLDGTGYGTDGAIWGFEVLAGGYADCRRIAHLAYSSLPGGEAAIRRPLMAAAGLVGTHLGEAGLDRFANLLDSEARKTVETARGLMRARINCPAAGSAGRLFDAVSAILGICRRQTYEGQAAIELGAAALGEPGRLYSFAWDGDTLSPAPLADGILSDMQRGASPAEAAGRFLHTMVEMLLACARRGRDATGLVDICLSGGTFQSAWLLERVSSRLTGEGFRVYRHRSAPPGDGGLALGQAMVVRRQWQQGRV